MIFPLLALVQRYSTRSSDFGNSTKNQKFVSDAKNSHKACPREIHCLNIGNIHTSNSNISTIGFNISFHKNY